MSFRRWPVLLALAVAITGASVLGARPGSAQELLTNGGFESGITGWAGVGVSATGCTPHTGSGAAAVAGSSSSLRLQQNLEGPFGPGTHTLTGWLKVDGGSADVVASLTWFDSDDNSLDHRETRIAAGSAYASFSLPIPSAAAAVVLQVQLRVTLSGDRVCFDDLSLSGPAPATSTPLPTDTPSPTSTSSETPTATSTETASPSSTPTPTSQVSTTPTPKATSTAAATDTPSPGLVFVNGDFSQGLYGWQKYGGSLTSSGGSGVLSSDSDSTKWAYETVAIDPGRYYEFSASLKPDAGVASAYLRISWYASGDGTGSAIDTTDSTETVAGPSASYQDVTTGSIEPAAGAHSARLRVMLSPDGAAPATLHFDNVAFGEAPPPSATPVPSATATTATATSTSKAASSTDTPKPPTKTPTPRNSATARVEKTQQAAAKAAAASKEPDSWDVTATPSGRISNVDAARRANPPEDGEASLSTEATSSGDGGSGLPVVWLIGAGMLIVGLGGAYVQGKRRDGPR